LQACEAGLADAKVIKEEPQKQRRRRDLLFRSAVLRRSLGDAQADEQFKEWADVATLLVPWNPFYSASAATSFLARAHTAGTLRGYLDSQLRQAASDSSSRALVDGLRSLWRDELWNETPTRPAPESLVMLNVMTPIAVELEKETLAQLGGHDAVGERYSSTVIAAIERDFGVRIPRARIREIDAPPGTYRILIHEVPREQGRLRMDAVGVIASIPPGIGGEAVQNTLLHDWRWIAPDGMDAARRHGSVLLTPLEMLLKHVEQTLVTHLVEFVGHQEVQNLLEKHQLVKPGESEKIVSLEAMRHMTPLTRVVRALVAERVPITSFGAIVARFNEDRAAGADPSDIVEDVRDIASIRPSLWGNDGGYALWSLGPNLEAELEQHLAAGPGSACIMTRDDRQRLVEVIRAQVQTCARSGVLVRRQRHRPFLRALISPVLPHMPVLSRREARPSLQRELTGTIELPASYARPTRSSGIARSA
jgi:flagellar biosynthesis component FlhA